MSSLANPKYAAPYYIYNKNPSFEIIFFSIDSIDEKGLSADITFSTHVVTPFDTDQVTILIDTPFEHRMVNAKDYTGRYELSGFFYPKGFTTFW